MALVLEIHNSSNERQRVHGPVECGYHTFTDSQGRAYLQLDTYGSPSRRMREKASQYLQFNEASAEQLLGLILKTFPGIRTRLEQRS